MKLFMRLVVALVVIALVGAWVQHIVRAVPPVPPHVLLLALLYAAVTTLGYVRLRSKETKPEKRLLPRRRALPPAPGDEA